MQAPMGLVATSATCQSAAALCEANSFSIRVYNRALSHGTTWTETKPDIRLRSAEARGEFLKTHFRTRRLSHSRNWSVWISTNHRN
jgi:wobble nucleotide-excising tRNase